MAPKTITTLVGDADGTEAAETLTFALNGTTYETDLNGKNADALRAVATCASKARQIGKQRRTGRTIKALGDLRNALIRAWAAREGIQVPARRAIPNVVQRQFDAAH